MHVYRKKVLYYMNDKVNIVITVQNKPSAIKLSFGLLLLFTIDQKYLWCHMMAVRKSTYGEKVNILCRYGEIAKMNQHTRAWFLLHM